MSDHPSPISIVTTIDELRAILDAHRCAGRTIGFVPTMGYLHDGHASLMRAAAADSDIVVVSVFVNPLQFAEGEDLDDYPRDLERDRALSADAGVDILFVPSGNEMYRFSPVLTSVVVGELSERFEAATRPDHFAGVSTVVTKLFAIVGACRAYFGEKDYQQLAIVTRLAADLSMPVTVVGCPIVREPNGLAMSSRNTYLTDAERDAAGVLRKALDAGVAAIDAGERASHAVEATMAAVVAAEPLATLDYTAVVDAATMETSPTLNGELRLLIAAQVGRPRLIDNCGATVPAADA